MTRILIWLLLLLFTPLGGEDTADSQDGEQQQEVVVEDMQLQANESDESL